MSMSRERREELRDYADNGESACPTKAEVRALLDERDRYWALLGQCREIAKAAINSGDWVVDGARDPDMVFHRIDAALEDKHD